MKHKVRIRSEYDPDATGLDAARLYFVEIEEPFLFFWKRWRVVRETSYLKVARIHAQHAEKGQDFHYVNPAHEDK